MIKTTTRALESSYMATDTMDARCLDHHTALSTHISIECYPLIVRFSKGPLLSALKAAMPRPYHPLLILTTMLFTVLVAKVYFMLADSPIIYESLTGEMQLLKLVATTICVQSLYSGRKQQQYYRFHSA